MIKRFKQKEIGRLMKQFPVIAIIGPRQCGKTTLALQMYDHKFNDALYFDLESPADRRRFDEPEYFLTALESKIIIIDEVQRLPGLFALLRSIVDKNKRKGRYLLLGSSTPHLIKGVSETLAGRIAYTEISTLNLTEIYKKQSDVTKHWFRGGFPDAWLSKNDTKCYIWMDNFFRTFIERDLNTLFGVNFSAEVMFKLWRMLAHFHGSVWNADSFSKGLDISRTTVNRYVNYLEGAFMLRVLPPYYTNSKKSIVKSPKIYIRDSGLLHYLNDIHHSKNIFNNPNVGNAWEGYVIEQIIQLLPSFIRPYYYRTHYGSEMDLVLVRGLKPIACIEIKSSNEPTLSRGFYESIDFLKTKKSFIITPHQNISYFMEKSIMVCGIHDFLTIQLQKIWKNK